MRKNETGKLTLVGAGPGDPELLTLKGHKAISQADIILYDALIPIELLNINPISKNIFVGKRRGIQQYAQNEINELIINYALLGLNVVRLKGGDPMVFGRAHEEILTAIEHGIECNVIPGISSYAGIAAYHRIPITKRAQHESFWVLTACTSQKQLSDDIALAAQSSATIIILMGMAFLPKIIDLFSKYKKADFPIAVIQNGTTQHAKSVYGTLQNIEQLVKSNNITNPANIIIGEAVLDEITSRHLVTRSEFETA